MGQSYMQQQIMPTIYPLIDACYDGDSARIDQMLEEKPELLNQQDQIGYTGLMIALNLGRTKTFKFLLSKPEIDLSLRNNNGDTVITMACRNDNVHFLKLLLLHPKCSKAIVEMKGYKGKTAEMIAKSFGYEKCLKLLKSFINPINSVLDKVQIDMQKKPFYVLMNSTPGSALSFEELVSEVKSLTSVQQEKEYIIRKHEEIEKKEIEKFDKKLQKAEVEHKRKLQTIEGEYEELKTKHNEGLLKMQASYKKERDLIEDVFSKGEVRKQELQDLVQGSPHSQAPNFLSAVPECYSCLEKYRPIVKLWTCGCGHSVCGNCYDKMPIKTCGQCRRPITCRATDLKKIIISLYNLN